MSTISVIASIVLFQHKPIELEKTLYSLTSQPEITKIILIDNGGSEWANEIKDNRFCYIKSHKNLGFGRAHNLAIKKFAKQSDYFIICNPDIEFESGTVKSILDAEKKFQAGLFMPKIAYPDGRRQELCKLLPTPIDLFIRRFIPILSRLTDSRYLLRKANFDQAFFAPSLSGCFMFCRSSSLINLGGFDERYFMYLEDIDLSRRFAIQFGAYYVPVATVYHDFQKASYKNKKLLKYHITSTIQYFNKWGWLFDNERRSLNKKCLEQLPIHTEKQN